MRKHVDDSLGDSDYYWDRANVTVMGQYFTHLEGSFIQEKLALHQPGVIFDAGGGKWKIRNSPS